MCVLVVKGPIQNRKQEGRDTPDRKGGTHQTGRKRDCIHKTFKRDDNAWHNYLYCKINSNIYLPLQYTVSRIPALMRAGHPLFGALCSYQGYLESFGLCNSLVL